MQIFETRNKLLEVGPNEAVVEREALVAYEIDKIAVWGVFHEDI